MNSGLVIHWLLLISDSPSEINRYISSVRCICLCINGFIHGKCRFYSLFFCVFLSSLLSLLHLNSLSGTNKSWSPLPPSCLVGCSLHESFESYEHIMWIYCTTAVQTALAFSVRTFLGENTPRVPPSSLMATPISASRASLRTAKSQSEASTHSSEDDGQITDNHSHTVLLLS